MRCGCCAAAHIGHRCCTQNLRALWTTLLLNTSFTIAQIFGAAAAHSLALLGDTGTMVVDSITYAVNIAAEYYKESVGGGDVMAERRSAKIEVFASLLSVLALLGVTAVVTINALDRLNGTSPPIEDDVDPDIMLGFTMVNLVIDIVMWVAIVQRRAGGGAHCSQCRRCFCCHCTQCCWRAPPVRHHHDKMPTQEAALQRRGLRLTWSKRSSNGPTGTGRLLQPRRQRYMCTAAEATEAAEVMNPTELGDVGSQPPGRDLSGQAVSLMADSNAVPQRDLNLCSAFAHVLADTMRTLTVMACALLVSVGGFDPSTTDAIGSLVVCGVITIVALYVTFEACSQGVALLPPASSDMETAAREGSAPEVGGTDSVAVGTSSSAASQTRALS